MTPAALILLGIIGGALATCTRTHLYLYKETKQKQVKIYSCYASYYEIVTVHKTGETTIQNNYTDVITDKCLTTIKSNSFHFEGPNYTLYNLRVNHPNTHYFTRGGTNSSESVTCYFSIRLEERTVKFTNGEIKLPWGWCKFSAGGNCSDPNDRTQSFVWDVNQMKKEASFCDSLSRVATDSFEQYLLKDRAEYLLLKGKPSYLLELKEYRTACGTEIWKTARKGYIVSLNPITGSTESGEALNRKWAVDKNAGHKSVIQKLLPGCAKKAKRRTESGLIGPISEYFIPDDADAQRVRELLQEVTYVLYVCIGILAYMVVTLLISIYDLVMNYYTFKTENRAFAYMFQSNINEFYVDWLKERKSGQEDDQVYYSTIK